MTSSSSSGKAVTRCHVTGGSGQGPVVPGSWRFIQEGRKSPHRLQGSGESLKEIAEPIRICCEKAPGHVGEAVQGPQLFGACYEIQEEGVSDC